MGDAQSSIAEHESMFRRVAIVLSSLPAPTASRLLETVDSQTRGAIHQVVATLSVIDPIERDQILDSFRDSVEDASYQSALATASSVQDEFVIGQSTIGSTSNAPSRVAGFAPAIPNSVSNANVTSAASSGSPFAFLDDVPPNEMATLLSGEHPQTIALVLASVSPKRAADVLPQLSSDQQSETLSRIGRLDDVDETTLSDVCEHLRSRLDVQTAANNVSSGKRALDAIIAQLPELAAPRPDATAKLNQTSASREVRLADGTWPASGAAKNETTWQSTESPHADLPQAESSQPELSPPELSPAELPSDGTLLRVHHDDEFVVAPTAGASEADESIHRYLVDLPAQTLCNALGLVSTRDALLTLCGLPNATAERTMALLPRSKAKQVRRGMATLGSLQLREIDTAKQAVAEVAKRSTENQPMLSAA